MKIRKHNCFLLIACLLFLNSCDLQKSFVNKIDKRYTKAGYCQKTITTNEYKIDYMLGGEGETILFIHGFLADGKLTWIRQAPYFIENFQVIVPDLLWFGDNKSNEVPSLNAQAKALKILTDSLQLKKIHVVGISYGGFVVLELYRIHPEIFKSLTIVDSPGPTYPEHEHYELLEYNKVKSASELFVPDNTKELKKLLKLVLKYPMAFPNFFLKPVFQEYYSEFQNEKIKLLEELIKNQGVLNGSPKINPEKCMIIWGEQDRVFPIETGLELSQYMNTELIVVRKAGHAVNFEQPKVFNKTVSEFILKNR